MPLKPTQPRSGHLKRRDLKNFKTDSTEGRPDTYEIDALRTSGYRTEKHPERQQDINHDRRGYVLPEGAPVTRAASGEHGLPRHSVPKNPPGTEPAGSLAERRRKKKQDR